MVEIMQNMSAPILDMILRQKVSYQVNAWSPLSSELTIKETLDLIKSDTFKQQISNLRNLIKNGHHEEYASHKKNLAAVTFCGSFASERKKTNLKGYNSVIVLDIDKLDTEELNRIKRCLDDEALVFSFWESPSQGGIKGLVYLHYTFEITEAIIDQAHKGAFKKLSIYFKDKYNIEIDVSGSDTTRLCFFSYDPSLRLKTEANPFIVTKDVISLKNDVQEKSPKLNNIYTGDRDILYNPKDKNNPVDRNTLQAIIKYLEKRNLSITYSYDEWYKTAMAIANSFTFDIGERYFQRLSSLDKDKYNPVNCLDFLMNCYESRTGAIKFSTIVFLAIEKGYKSKI
jgi:hypothetical protein